MSDKTKGVQVATCTAKELLGAKGLNLPKRGEQEALKGELCIPEYQRPYRWQAKQIQRLLTDMAEHREREQKRLVKGREDNKEPTPIPYYLGSAILHRDTEGKLNIIDGQQRITTLALLGQLQDNEKHGSGLVHRSPLSQQQVTQNLRWLNGLCDKEKKVIKDIDFSSLVFTLVVTDLEDDAYLFFETQNTGGVRLSGPDIIKAHHLRVVDKESTNDLALRWEAMGDLRPVVDLLLRGRYWGGLGFRDYPRQNQKLEIRSHIVSELAVQTGTENHDVAFGRVSRTRHADGGEKLHLPTVGYELRQPLNSGTNAIHYLQYFEQLRRKHLAGLVPDSARQGSFPHFYHQLVCKFDGGSYLKRLYDTCLLTYISQFGEQRLYTAAVKFFRVVYSPRVAMQMVRESSVSKFADDTSVLDWIALSYTSEKCFEHFDGFELVVSEEGLSSKKKGVKMRFVLRVSEYFSLKGLSERFLLESEASVVAESFAEELSMKALKGNEYV